MYNTLIHYGIEVIILSVVVLIVGLFKPKWIFLWMDKPGRFPVIWLASALFMAGMVLFGEGNKRLATEKSQTTKTEVVQPANEVPVPASNLPAETK
jgi:hypothetical protein